MDHSMHRLCSENSHRTGSLCTRLAVQATAKPMVQPKRRSKSLSGCWENARHLEKIQTSVFWTVVTHRLKEWQPALHSVCLADVPKRCCQLQPTTHNQLKPGGSADVRKQSVCQRTKFKSVLNSNHPRRDLWRLNVGETIRMQPLEHRRHLRPSRPSEHDTTHDRAETWTNDTTQFRTERSSTRSGNHHCWDKRSHNSTTGNCSSLTEYTTKKGSCARRHATTWSHGYTIRESSQARGQIGLVIDQVYGQVHIVMYQACRWTELNCSWSSL